MKIRGIIQSTETGFYYLGSRYYDPGTVRFINSDSQLNVDDGILGYNMFAYCNNNPVNYYDPNGTDCICLTQRVRGNHVCYDPDEISFEETYYNNTGKRYDYQFDKYEDVSVVKSKTTITEGDVIVEKITSVAVGGFLTYATAGAGMSAVVGGLWTGTTILAAPSSLGAGTYPTYTVTKTYYYKCPIEVANYHGYKVYQDKMFRCTVTEIYYLLNGEFAKIDIFYSDGYAAYKYRNRY